MNSLTTTLSLFNIGPIPRAILLVLLGFILARLSSFSVEKTFKKRMTPHHSMLFQHVAFYIVFILFLISAVQQLGFQIGTLLGATGIMTIAIGIASQTSLSNIISGIFIIGEKPFEIGDTVKINDLQGEILSIDFLSVKIRTKDNMLVRVPNETLIKSPIINISYFPMRRIDFLLGVNYQEDIPALKKILLAVAQKNALALDDPKPDVIIDSIGDSIVNLQLSIWTNRNDFKEAKSSIQEEINQALIEHQIELPISSRSFTLNSLTEPLPIMLVDQEKTS